MSFNAFTSLEKFTYHFYPLTLCPVNKDDVKKIGDQYIYNML